MWLLKYCPKCGAANDAGDTFCGECGASLKKPAAPADAVQASAPAVPAAAVATAPAVKKKPKRALVIVIAVVLILALAAGGIILFLRPNKSLTSTAGATSPQSNASADKLPASAGAASATPTKAADAGAINKLVIGQGDWVYYTNPGDSWNIYRMHADGTGMQFITSDTPRIFSFFDGWIYYADDSDSGSAASSSPLVKIRLDGSGKQIIRNDARFIYFVDNTWIYFSGKTVAGTYGLCRIHPDSTGFEHLSSVNGADYQYGIKMNKSGIVFSNDHGLFRVNPDGSDIQQIDTQQARIYGLFGDWLYYYNNVTNNDFTFSRVRIDGTGNQKLKDVYPIEVDVNGGLWTFSADLGNWFYFCKKTDFTSNTMTGKVYRMRPDGSEQQETGLQLQDVSSNEGIVARTFTEDWCYYLQDKSVYKVRIDGTSRMKLATLKNDDAKGSIIMIVQDDTLYVYHYENNNLLLYALRTDGTDLRKLS